MHYVISADDLGASRGVTARILEAADTGLLTSVSAIATGVAVEYGVREAQRRGLRVSLHLNFVEGRPLSRPGDVPLLVGEDGTFRLDFLGLWRATARSRGAARAAWKEQLGREMRAQIERLRELVSGDWPVSIDSHLHLHMVPLAFETLLELSEDYRFRYVRVLDEPFFLATEGAGAARNYLGPNLLKHTLLNRLSRPAKRALRARRIPYCDRFVGVLFTGNMRTAVAREALARAARAVPDGIIELLFHPGRADPAEEQIWPERLLAFREQYRSPWRDRERETLCDPDFVSLFDEHRRYASPEQSH